MKPPPGLSRAVWHSCNNGSCVEVTVLDNRVWVRGSTDVTGAVQAFTYEEWDTFIEGAKKGLFDREQLASRPDQR
ncbi:DUF397 domain-containing protein [Nonomuraea rhizosphaerae]|uniref:DUF397 domain-containing protein n=1 Tax=Nonomuraea rhizosphaerae TaxID=2665663 RepID=UPI001C5D03E5|nr:DUF397 domain-containing protein [Nonomuraea rhizosphaerae]